MSVYFLDCLQKDVRGVYCFGFAIEEGKPSKEWEKDNLLNGFGAVGWDQRKRGAAKAAVLKLIVPMPVADKHFGLKVKCPTITIYRRSESEPDTDTNDYVSFQSMEVVSKRNLGSGTIKVPSAFQGKVGTWNGESNNKMFIPTVLILSRMKT